MSCKLWVGKGQDGRQVQEKRQRAIVWLMFLIENVYQDFVLLLVIALNRFVIVRAWFRHCLSQPHTRGDVGLLVDRAIVAHISWCRSCNWRQFVRRQNSNVRQCCARGFCRSRYSTRKNDFVDLFPKELYHTSNGSDVSVLLFIGSMNQ